MAISENLYNRRKYEERAAERVRVAQGLRDVAAANVPSGWGGDSVEANTPSAPSRSFGFQSGAAVKTPEAAVNQVGLREAAELGSPESYEGGRLKAGAPAPVAIMRGARTTFQNAAADQGEGGGYVQTPGSSPQEYSSSLRAGQAYNRGTGVKGYDPVEGPNLRLAAELDRKNPLQKAQAEAITGDRMDKLLRAQVTREYGTDVKGEDGVIKRVLHPEFDALIQGHLLNSPQDVEEAMKKVKAEAPTVQKIIQYNSPEARKQAEKNYALMAGPNANPAELERIRSAPITRNNLKGFEEIYNYKPQGSGQTSLRQPEADSGAAAGVLDRAALLGKTLSYEMQPSLRKAGTPAPTLESVRRDRIAGRQRIWDEEENLRAGAPSAM